MITCTFEDNGIAKLRHVTVNALIIKDGKVLLGKRGTYNGGKPLLEAGKWALIGGFLSRDETIEQALKREIKEESGWEVDNLRLLHIKDNPDRPAEDRQNVEFVYLADAINKTSESDEEVSKLEWFSLDSIPQKEEIAFDHQDDLTIYTNFLKNNFPLPVIGKY
jgi:8-oxo-dGTP diphosphatase